MSNIYKIGTRGLTPSDNNYLVWDADVRCLYIDKENKVDVLNIVDTFNTTGEGLRPLEFIFTTGGYIIHMKRQTSGEYAGKYTDEYAWHIIYDVVWDAEAKQISSLTYNDYDFSNNIWFLHLTEVTGDVATYEGSSEVGAITKTATVQNIITKFTGYSTEAIPTLAAVKDVFNTEYFKIADGIRVAPKLATTSVKGVASFNSNQFSTSSGQVSLKTTTNKTAGTTYTNYVDYVKERWTSSDGTMWYRLWTSGWVEQGGVLINSSAATKTVSFPIEFADLNYSVLYTAAASSSGNTQVRYHSVKNLETTSFTVYSVVGTKEGNRWYACGWSA